MFRFMLLALVSSPALSQPSCHTALLAGSVDSSHYEVYVGEQHDISSTVLNLIHTQCGEGVVADIGPVHCRNIIPYQEHTRVCAVETKVGYFIITQDYVSKYHIIFNRWD